jgi:DNA-binding response OmpR family regulator
MKKILIIEDEPDVAESIKMYLENEGYQADISLDPMEGVGKLPGYDLLLLDLIMPKVSGRVVLKELKSRKMTVPVIVLSAVGLPKMVGDELKRDYPSVRFIPKTEMYSKLVPTIKSIIGA